MIESRDLNALREAATRTLIALLWLHVGIAAAIGLARGTDWLAPTLFAAALAAVATLSWRMVGNGLSTRLVFAVAAMGGVAVFTYQMSGHPWQIDLHMYFFAVLAFLVAYCDYRPIAIGTAAVALHHLVLNFVLPAAIFPGGTDLARVVLHAVILVVEAGVLVWLALQLERLFITAEKKTREAEAANAAQASANAARGEALERERIALAEKAERDRLAAEEKSAADERAAHEREAAAARIMDEFDAAVGGIVKAAMAGDFSQRVPLEGREGVVRNLAGALNDMCATMGKVMDELGQMLGALAEGDLTRRIEADYRGMFGTVKDKANITAERLSQTISEIKSAAREVAEASAEIATRTTDLAQRTEEQAAGLERTSASMEEISTTVKKNAENAQHARNLTGGTREMADRGGEVVASAVEAMSRIEESSRKISDIIGVIDEIARQTNLLALNAAVEAARAGDAGRGFAVVASEVRSLAQRSSQAAKDIKDLITSSSAQVQEGVGLVSRAGQSLEEIVQSIKSVADIVADIAHASTEQATGVEQTTRALSQMDEATQQNSALVEENAATVKMLEQQSQSLDQLVSAFHLDRGSRSVSHRTAQAA